MLKAFAGLIVGTLTAAIVGRPWAWAVGYFVLFVALQAVFARSLNVGLGGADPLARFGARNLSQLRMHVRVPVHILALNFAAKTALFAAVTSVLIGLGLLELM
jgi:hypothetical protein